ncbi:MAG: uridine kinase [Acidimicrobiaceae bacterium]|nr:uridine kinase [Acidimicrobiaceae bacterium]
MSSKFVGIAGGSCSGKTTVVNTLVEAFEGSVSTIAFDSYYRDQGHMTLDERTQVNYDHPDSLDVELFVSDIQSLRDGSSIETPIYNFSTHTRSNESKIVTPSDLVVLDGILLLAFPEITNLLDLAVFIEASEEIRYKRRIPRDIQERGRTAEQSSAQFKETVQPMHKRFVAPSICHADLVIDGEQSPQVSLAEITSALYRQN